jgi:hypothetical protein
MLSGTTSIQRAGDSIALVEASPPVAVLEAVVSGELARDDAGCLVVDTGSRQYVLQFPYGTAIAEDGEAVDVPGHGLVRIGDSFRGGGGVTSVDRAAGDCEADEYAVWQTIIE